MPGRGPNALATLRVTPPTPQQRPHCAATTLGNPPTAPQAANNTPRRQSGTPMVSQRHPYPPAGARKMPQRRPRLACLELCGTRSSAGAASSRLGIAPTPPPRRLWSRPLSPAPRGTPRTPAARAASVAGRGVFGRALLRKLLRPDIDHGRPEADAQAAVEVQCAWRPECPHVARCPMAFFVHALRSTSSRHTIPFKPEGGSHRCGTLGEARLADRHCEWHVGALLRLLEHCGRPPPTRPRIPAMALAKNSGPPMLSMATPSFNNSFAARMKE